MFKGKRGVAERNITEIKELDKACILDANMNTIGLELRKLLRLEYFKIAFTGGVTLNI